MCAPDRLADRAAQLALVELGDGGQGVVVEPAADGERAQHLLGAVAEALDAHHQRVAQRAGERAAAVEPAGQQLLA